MLAPAVLAARKDVALRGSRRLVIGPEFMETAPPFQVVTGQRQLAVIMFTDAVGYSAQMHEQEIATLNRLERDVAAMRRIAESHSGLVLKSTGDGLLIQFTSAVEAVASALEIQRYFQSRTDSGVSTSTLRHRIGVHLGDVFVGNGDAMGDGVNIAARLVNEAQPGGIVISHMVYDVVKNKLPLHVQRVGPQKLKNITEPVILYKVLLDAPAASASNPTPVTAPAASAAAPEPKRGAGRAVLLLAMGLAAVAAVRFGLQQHFAHEEELIQRESAHATLGKLLQNSTAGNPPAPADGTPAGFDFAALTTHAPAESTAAARPAAEKSAAVLLAWLPAGLERYTRDRPLLVRGIGDPAFQGTTLFTDANRQLFFNEGGASRRRNWSELKEPVQAAIIVRVLLDAPASLPPGVREGAEAYAYLHGQPEMLTALRR